jgi:subtilisin family serine protease
VTVVRILRRFRAVGSLAALVMAFACADDGPAGPDPEPGDGPPSDVVPDQVLARLAPGVEVAEVNGRYGTSTISAVETQRVYLLGLPEGSEVEQILPALRADPDVTSASANGVLAVPEAQGRSTMAFADPSLQRPDREDQAAVGRIRASQAWGRSRGQGIVVAVLDTGVDAGHPQLAGHIEPGGVDLVDADADPSDTPDGIDNDGDDLVDEAVGHGTFVAGLILAAAPDARILPIRILDSDGVGSADAIASGIEIAVDRGARIVNLSLGMEIESDVLEEVIEEQAREKGIVFVASAGNRDSDQPQYPAGQSEVMAVAATTPGDSKADFSNWGSWVSLSAPGVGLVSVLPAAGMGRWSGTSFSSALVSGEAAVLIGFAPFARSDEVRGAMEESAVELGDFRLNGAGRIDIAAALDLLDDRLGGGAEEIEFDARVASIDPVARLLRLDDGTVLVVPHDGVVDRSGDYRTLAGAAAAVSAGVSVRAEGEAIQDGGGLRAIEVRLEDANGSEDDDDDSSGPGGGDDGDDDDPDDSSGPGGGDDDPDDSSGSGGGDDDPDDSSGSGGDDDDPDDSSGSGGDDSDDETDDG